jgi:hypothetical protein
MIASLLLTVAGTARAADRARPDRTLAGRESGGRIYDLDTTIDVNSLEMFVSNRGSFANNAMAGDPGLLYPRGTDHAVVFAGGIWIFGMVDGGLRGAIAEYSQEYGPGWILEEGWSDQNDPSARVYKLTPASGPGDPDFDEWPAAQGAPLDSDGAPLKAGDQTLWSTFHDANPSHHTNNAGGTEPIGLEVHHLTYAYDLPDPLDRAIIMDYRILNKGDALITDAFAGFWFDGDIGGFTDDLCGSDSLLEAAYMYNGEEIDEIYGPIPPAVAVTLLKDPGQKRPKTYAASAYINGLDPDTPEESYNYLRGLSADGDPRIDPVTGRPTRFWYGGDPVTGEGWVDQDPSDKRFLLSAGPFELDPWEELRLRVAVVVGQGPDRIASVEELRTGLRIVRRLGEKRAFPDRERWALAGFYPQPFCAGEDPLGWAFLVAPAAADVDLMITDPAGRLVRRLAAGWSVEQGIHPVFWDGRDEAGEPVPPGSYRLLLGGSASEGPGHSLVWDREALLVECPGSGRPAGSTLAESLKRMVRPPAPERSRSAPMVILHGSGTIPVPRDQAIGTMESGESPAVVLYDLLGRRVTAWTRAEQEAGFIRWDGRDGHGRRVPSGMYLLYLAGRSRGASRVLLVR